MKATPPNFLQQERLQRILRSSFRRALVQAHGAEPAETELDAIVRREFPALADEFGSSFLLRLAKQPALSAPPLRQCIDQFHLAKRQEKLAPQTLHCYHLRLDHFTAQFGERRPATISAKDLSAYLARWPHPATRLAYWETLSTFFNWMLRVRYILENPLSQAMRRPVVRKGAGLIYSPEEAAHLLRLTKHSPESKSCPIPGGSSIASAA